MDEAFLAAALDDAPAEAAAAAADECGAASAAAADAPKRENAKNAQPVIFAARANDAAARRAAVEREPRSGVRVRQRLLSEPLLRSVALEHAFVPLARAGAEAARAGAFAGRDIFTIAVLVHKGLPKAARGGAKFVVWKLSDLSGASLGAPSALFVFGGAYREWWKELEGSVLAVLNPRLIDERDPTSPLKVEAAEQLQKIGTAADFGTCRGVRRDGQACTMHVNTAQSPYCQFHVHSAGRQARHAHQSQAAARRSALLERASVAARASATATSALRDSSGVTSLSLQQRSAAAAARAAPPTAKSPLDKFNIVRVPSASSATSARPGAAASTAAVRPTLHSHGSASAGQRVVTVRGSFLLDKKRGAAAAQGRMVLSQRALASLKPKPANDFLLPHVGKRELKRLATGSAATFRQAAPVHDKAAHSQLLREAQKAAASAPARRGGAQSSATTKASDAARAQQRLAALQESLGKSSTSISTTSGSRFSANGVQSSRLAPAAASARSDAAAKAARSTLTPAARAAALLRMKKRPTKSIGLPSVGASAAKRARVASAAERTPAAAGAPTGEAVLSDQRREELRKASSLHEETVSLTSARQDAMLNSLGEREAAAKAAFETKELSVAVWRCEQCARTSEKKPDLCANAGHPVRKLRERVAKRFFRCTRCNERTFSLGSRMPAQSCIKCNGDSFAAISLGEFRRQREVDTLLPAMRLNYDAPELEAIGVRPESGAQRWRNKSGTAEHAESGNAWFKK